MLDATLQPQGRRFLVPGSYAVDRAGVGGELQVKLQQNGRAIALTIEPDQLATIQNR